MVPRVNNQTSLGRVLGDSGVHSVLASVAAGWSADGALIPEAGLLRQLLHTVGYIHDFAGVVRIGEPLEPLQDLEVALLEAPQGVRLSAVSSVESQWTWVSESPTCQTTVVMDEDAFHDCRSVVEELGLLPHVVPSSMPLEDRTKLASRGASLVVEQSRVPRGWHSLPGTEVLREIGHIWFGLVGYAEPVRKLSPGCVAWLAFASAIERAGGLREVLGAFVQCGIDLKHLHSFRRTDGSYAFSCTFRVDGSHGDSDILEVLAEREIAHRLLAYFPAPETQAAGRLLDPQWDHVDSSAGLR